MKLKLDENLSHRLKDVLGALEHDVSTVADEGLLSQPDPIVAEAARKEGRLLLTLDVEFGDLRKYPPGSHPGIIPFRPHRFSLRRVNEMIEAFVRTNDLASFQMCVAVVEPGKVRLRRPAR